MQIRVPKEFIKSTSRVPAKDPPKVKLVIEESSITQKVRVRKLHIP